MKEYRINQINPKEADQLIDELDHYLSDLYPPESNHLESIEALSKNNVIMYGCKMNGTLVAIGATELMENYGELKRIYVSPQSRGENLASKIIDKLESDIKNSGLKHSRLETGIHQKEALGLFQKMGYTKRRPFGEYAEDPNSVFMEKHLNNHQT